MGGLGNQLFQFAAGRRLASRHGSELVLDLGWFRYEAGRFGTPRRYELKGLGVEARTKVLHPRTVAALDLERRRRVSRRRLTLIRQREGDYGVDERVLSADDDVLLIGYWQSETYFADTADAIRAELQISRAPSVVDAQLAGRPKGNAVAVHVRRGDYVSNPTTREFHGVLDRDYYRRALEFVSKRVDDPVFVAFSDEPEWVRRELASELPLNVVSTGDALEDLRSMSRCLHHVTANSSFGWWGAWLGERDGSVICAPQRWFADEQADTGSIVPERWQRL